MAAEAWLLRGADAMWGRLDAPPNFPRDPTRLARYGFRVRLMGVPALRLSVVAERLRSRDFPCPPAEPDRELRGCLVHFNETTFLFFDSRDDAAEQRYTIAHELAHLWLEILEQRERVRRRLGEPTLEVLDGVRPPTGPERFQAILAGVTLQLQHHLLERDQELGVQDGGVLLAEERADRLALELLAPADEARRRLPADGAWDQWVPEATARLETAFGLPRPIAKAYARRLGQEAGLRQDFWGWMSGAHLASRRKGR